MNSEQIGKTIKELRIKKNLTQKEFADMLGVTYQAVSKWENGKNLPDIAILSEISKIFNINIDFLLTGKKKDNTKIWIISIIALFLIIVVFIGIIIRNESNFEFKTITSDCSEFNITGSAAYNKDKTYIYISNVDYCGEENNTIYKTLECTLYEEYRNTKTKIGTCGKSEESKDLDSFLETVEINVNDYTASCKMFKSSLLYMEIKAVNEFDNTIMYQIPINLEDNCKQ